MFASGANPVTLLEQDFDIILSQCQVFQPSKAIFIWSPAFASIFMLLTLVNQTACTALDSEDAAAAKKVPARVNGDMTRYPHSPIQSSVGKQVSCPAA